MPIPAQRDLALARARITDWFVHRHPMATDVCVSEVIGPDFTGFSNETLIFDAGWTEDGERQAEGLVARVKPTGFTVFLESEFDVQYRVLQVLGSGTDLPVPRVVAYEADPQFLGAPFFVMEKVDGRIPTDTPPYHAGGWVTEVSPAERGAMWWSGIEAMAAIHRVDWQALGLQFLDRPGRGRPGLEQQLAYYEDYLAWAKAGEPNPIADAALAWLKNHLPGDEPLRLCWGDARIGNMIFDHTTCVAVLDWEMVTLGNPVQDLAWWLFLDRHHSDGMEVPRLDGFPTWPETVARWEHLTGLKAGPDAVFFYEVFAGFRFAVIMQRLIHMVIEYELLPPDSDQAVNNAVTRLLAGMLGLAPPGSA